MWVASGMTGSSGVWKIGCGPHPRCIPPPRSFPVGLIRVPRERGDHSDTAQPGWSAHILLSWRGIVILDTVAFGAVTGPPPPLTEEEPEPEAAGFPP